MRFSATDSSDCGLFGGLRNRRGASMIMIMALIGMVVVMSFGVSQIIVASIRTGVKLENADEAYYVSEGGVEKALKEVKAHDAGYSTSAAQKTQYNEKSTGSRQPGSQKGAAVTVGNEAYSNYEIQGRIADRPFKDGGSKDKYSVPATGDGAAGGKGCRDLGPIVSQQDLYKDDDMVAKARGGKGKLLFTDPADHPCNWGVIRPRETVTIPLYVQESDTKYLNPAMTMDFSGGSPTAGGTGLGMKNLVMRFRTPCKKQQILDGNGKPTGKEFRPTVCEMNNGSKGREELEVDQNKFADIVVNWQIVADEWDGSAGDGVSGRLRVADGTFGPFSSTSDSSVPRALFLNSSLQNSKPFSFDELFDVEVDGLNEFLEDFLNIQGVLPQIHKPNLKLSLNKPLKNNSQSKDSVPYLEYQIISDKRLADPSPLIEVEGFQNGVKQTIKIQPSIEKGILDFAVD